VTLDTDGEIKVAGYSGEAAITASAMYGNDNTATTTITADGDLKVEAYNGTAAVEALAKYGVDNTTGVAIDVVGGDVMLVDESGGETAKIDARSQYALNSNTSDVQITATAVEVIEEVDQDVFKSYVKGGNVRVISRDGGYAKISAFAGDTYSEEPAGVEETSNTNTANVTIRTTGIEVTKLVPVYNDGPYDTLDPPPEPVYEEHVYMEGGNVEVDALDGGESFIHAVTVNGGTNDSDVLICADGHVEVLGGHDSPDGRNRDDATAMIRSIAHRGVINDAYTGVSAGGTVEVRAGHSSGVASISSIAFFGRSEGPAEKNTATTAICTDGSVEVVDLCRSGEDASITATAKEGIDNDASVGICADGDVLVAAGLDDMGGTAMIKAEAEGYQEDGYDGPQTSADAKVTVVSHNGGVGVIDFASGSRSVGTALIKAYAHNAYTNTADVGIAAGGFLEDYWPEEEEGVFVWNSGEGSVAGILALAQNGLENTADVVVCTPYSVEVWNENGHIAGIGALAFEGEFNSATTQVYAKRFWIGEDAYIGAWAQGEEPKYVEFTDGWVFPGDSLLDATGDGDNSTLILDSHENSQDCPDCPPCPTCEDDEPNPIPPPPLYWPAGLPLEREEFAQGGCPALMAWLADEIGVPAEDIDVVVADVFAMSTDIQPCDTCAKLMNASKTLQDDEGTRIAAMAQVVNEFVTTAAPPSPEQMTQIAAAFAEHAGDGTHYASAGQWIDAIVAYVGIMNAEMGYSAADSVAFAEKYLTPVTGSGNAALAAYVQARLAALGG
ncbi:MAG: hypothetical protein ACYSUY_19405, partial [Planctomycetota bacterium]